ncbi:alkylation response protein AidB-like acyl-CoA dehydrogenase [Jatrophihabitans sp. GAS493]|uniref:acyl-CoA dehydrogenase family protein n=1 Tax=Jatrophihabitans sp. GAS493 TaxID=1907575 RepID=UPI000BB7D408|nr:acyl-CoA dehydrogenase family protein [Jatrophihabitans sp. GAS493]SOD72095.1 alkylation response protein AidB-like acyl-CoA dehydrogenase [Jatrophihabitans sp. GAS493]
MDYDLGESAAALRARLRHILADLLPEGWAGPFKSDPAVQKVTRNVCERLGAERLLTISWPQEYGGAAASEWEQAVLREEMWAHFEPRGAQYMGLSWVGPTIMHFGTPEQKAQHLPPIASGQVIWAQGFSEPESGSDLGSLSLAATPDGDGWCLNGQKIWTSYANIADWYFVAARTSRAEGVKTDGISIFIIPMSRTGVTVRPIDSMMGEQHLNEVFFDDVRVERAELLGKLNRGWDVIKYVLGHERIGIPRYARDERVLSALAEVDDVSQGACGVAFARALVHARTARLLNYRAVSERERGTLTDLHASTARIASILLDQEVAELALDTVGAAALAPDPRAGVLGLIEDVFRYSRSATIASGTIEVQRMIVARARMAQVSS